MRESNNEKKHFAENLHKKIYDTQIAEAGIPLKTSVENIVSIKIRPLTTSPENEYVNAYASDWDYIDFRDYLEKHRADFSDLDTDLRSALITLNSGNKILYIEHETGPEFLFDVTLKAIDFVTTAGGLILFLVDLMKKNDDKNFKKSNGKNRIEAVSIEIRKKGKKTKVTRIVRIEGIENIDLDSKEIKALIKLLK